MKAFLVSACLLLPHSLLAQTVVRVSFADERAPVNQAITVHIDFENAKNPWCGLRIVFGDGEVRDMRVDALPLNITKAYSQPGTYVVTVEGTYVSRGLKSAMGCAGRATSGQVTVFDPVEEQRKAEAAKAAETKRRDEERKRLEVERLAREQAEELQRLRQQLEKEKERAKRPPAAESAPASAAVKPPVKSPAASKPDKVPVF